MSIKEITYRVSALGNAWEEFKQLNAARLRDIERKGNPDPLYSKHLHNLNAVLDNHAAALDRIERKYASQSCAVSCILTAYKGTEK
jgi:hypothetical protein